MFAWFQNASPENRGALLLVLGISIFGFSDNLTLLVSDQVGVGQFHLCRSIFAILLIIAVSRFLDYSMMPVRWKPMIARTAFMVIAIFVYFSVMPMMPIAEDGFSPVATHRECRLVVAVGILIVQSRQSTPVRKTHGSASQLWTV